MPYIVTAEVMYFETLDEALKFRDELSDAFAEMPESEGLAAVFGAVEDEDYDEDDTGARH